jgi:CO/xanthine dehydrogenase Mo-binding subunit
MIADADAFNAAQAPGSPLRRGVGLAGMWYRFGKSGSLRIAAEAELRPDGGFTIYCSAPDYGQGINTTLTQIAAEVLGIERDAVTLINADTALTPDSGVQGASRATYWVGSAVARAADNLRLAVLSTAAEMVGCAPNDLTLHSAEVICEGEPGLRVPLSEVAQQLDAQGSARRVGGRFDPSPLFPLEGREPSAQAESPGLHAQNRPAYTPHFVTGANASEVEVDLETGQVQVLRIAAAHDVGRAINPPDAEGQIEGAVMMGLGTALCEEFRPGLTRGFVDYILPMVDAMPEIKAILVEVPGFHGPLGAKGLGEAAILPATPAIINAISRAIGARIRRIPATPERVLAAIRSIH